MDECKRRIGDTVIYSKDMYDAINDADALLMLTEWKQFRMPNFDLMKKSMKMPLIIDGRNIYDSFEMKRLGFEYYCIGI
jgi:UDPglucose 6-dehydrogenase